MLDIAPWPKENGQPITDRHQIKEVQKERKAEKKAWKKRKKAEKKAAKEQKKLEKAREKAQKKAAGKETKSLSSNSLQVTTATVQVPASPASAPIEAALPTGVVLAVCASLLICFGSAWLYGRNRCKPGQTV